MHCATWFCFYYSGKYSLIVDAAQALAEYSTILRKRLLRTNDNELCSIHCTHNYVFTFVDFFLSPFCHVTSKLLECSNTFSSSHLNLLVSLATPPSVFNLHFPYSLATKDPCWMPPQTTPTANAQRVTCFFFFHFFFF